MKSDRSKSTRPCHCEQTLPGIERQPPSEDVDLLEFFRLAGQLKMIPRQGWVDRGVLAPESVADHTYRMALMAWVLGAEAGLDTARLVKLVLVHDLPEALAGDATPYQALIQRGLSPEDASARWHDVLTEDEIAIGREEKMVAERGAIRDLLTHLEPRLAGELEALWTEYAQRSTPEAQFVSQIDKLEALIQAVEYERAGQPADVASFRRTAEGYVTHPVLRRLLDAIAVVPPPHG